MLFDTDDDSLCNQVTPSTPTAPSKGTHHVGSTGSSRLGKISATGKVSMASSKTAEVTVSTRSPRLHEHRVDNGNKDKDDNGATENICGPLPNAIPQVIYTLSSKPTRSEMAELQAFLAKQKRRPPQDDASPNNNADGSAIQRLLRRFRCTSIRDDDNDLSPFDYYHDKDEMIRLKLVGAFMDNMSDVFCDGMVSL